MKDAAREIATHAISQTYAGREPKLVFVVVAFESPVEGYPAGAVFDACTKQRPCDAEEVNAMLNTAARLFMATADALVRKLCELGHGKLVERDIGRVPK